MSEYVVDRGNLLGSDGPFSGLPLGFFRSPLDWSKLPVSGTSLPPSLDVSEDEQETITYFPLTGQQIAKLHSLYEFREDADVEAFLKDHPYLIQVLLGAYDEIREYFGFRSRIALKISRDPEARADGQLFVLIQTRLRPKTARNLLSELSQKWWHDKYSSTKGNMTISLEYLKQLK